MRSGAALLVVLLAAGVTAQVPARIRAAREISVPAQAAGVVVERPAARQSAVKKDDVILRIDPTFHRIALKKAEAALAKAQAESAWARIELERARELARTDTTSGSEVDRLKAQESAAAASVAAAEAAVEEARELLLRTEVRAPADGVLVELLPECGEAVAIGAVVARVFTVQDLVAEAFLTASEAAAFSPGGEATVRVLEPAAATLRGRVREIAAAAGPERTFRIVVGLAGAPASVRPGADARLILP